MQTVDGADARAASAKSPREADLRSTASSTMTAVNDVLLLALDGCH